MSDIVCYVRSVLDNEVTIICHDKTKSKFLRFIGARKRFLSKSEWVIKYSSDKNLADIFLKLRDGEFLFSYDEHGWGPSDIFRYHRDNGLLTGNFKEVFWTGGGQYRISNEK